MCGNRKKQQSHPSRAGKTNDTNRNLEAEFTTPAVFIYITSLCDTLASALRRAFCFACFALLLAHAVMAAVPVDISEAVKDSHGLQVSVNDDREFKHLVLDNKLRVLLVSDHSTDKVRMLRHSHHADAAFCSTPAADEFLHRPQQPWL